MPDSSLAPVDLSSLSTTDLQAALQAQQEQAGSTITAAPLAPIPGTNKFGEPFTGGDGDLSAYSIPELQAAMANNRPAMSTAEDVGRSATSGLQQGTAFALTTPGQILNLWGHGVDWLGDKALGAAQDVTGNDLGAPYHGADLGRRAAAPDLAPDTTNYAHLSGLTDPEDAFAANQRLTGPYHEPQTTAGRYVGAVARVIPSALTAAESLPSAVLSATGAGVGSQAASDLTAGTPLEPLAPWVGGLVGGGLAQGLKGAVRSPEATVARYAKNIPAPQFDAARTLMGGAESIGAPLTWAEAIQQAGGGANGLGRLQRLLESTSRGETRLSPFFAARPDNVRGAVMDFADQIAPPTANPSMLGMDAQRAAQGITTKLGAVRSKATAPLYTAADTQQVPASDISDLVQTIDGHLASDKTGLLASGLKPFRDHLMPGGQPLTDIGNLDRVRKYYRDQIGLPDIAANALSREQAGAVGGYLDRLDGLMEQHSPAFAAGKTLHGDLSRQLVEPITSGPIGTIAGSPAIATQTGALYPASPPEGAAAETGVAARLLNGEAPAVVPGLTRQHIVGTFNSAAKDLQNGANQWGGANFVKAVAGNPEQRAALGAGIDSIGGPALSDRLGQVLDVLQATGKRQHPGSLTAYNESDMANLGKAPKIISGPSKLLNFDQYGKAIEGAFSGLQFKRNVDALSDWLTSGAQPTGRSASILDTIDPTAANRSKTVLQWLSGHP